LQPRTYAKIFTDESVMVKFYQKNVHPSSGKFQLIGFDKIYFF